MFELFGEFDSAEELNASAAGLLKEGDTENLYKLAEENGIDKDDVKDYEDGLCECLTSTKMAAFGKLKVEANILKPQEIVEDWMEYIKAECLDADEMAKAVRRKDKSLKGCIAELLKWSFTNCYAVDKEIMDAAGVKNANCKMGIPGMGRAKKIIKEYYMR